MDYLSNEWVRSLIIAARKVAEMYEEGEFDTPEGYLLWKAYKDLRTQAKHHTEIVDHVFGLEE